MSRHFSSIRLNVACVVSVFWFPMAQLISFLSKVSIYTVWGRVRLPPNGPLKDIPISHRAILE